MSDTPYGVEVADAAQAISEAASEVSLVLTGPVSARLAVAALQSYERVVEVQDGVPAGVWESAPSRAAVRRRLRDRAAIEALDEGFTLTAAAHERVVGIDDAGEELDPAEAEVVVVTHTYPARRLLSDRPGESGVEHRDSTIPEQDPREDRARRARLRPVP
jgi:hypothetical protein